MVRMGLIEKLAFEQALEGEDRMVVTVVGRGE